MNPENYPALTVIIPTVGRESLLNTLASIRRQEIGSGDMILLVVDGPQYEETTRKLVDLSTIRDRIKVDLMVLGDGPHNNYGHTARNRAMQGVTGDYLLFIDDDDEYLPNALRTVRAAIREKPGCMFLFRMYFSRKHFIIWTRKDLSYGNISTQMVVVPNIPEKLGVWEETRYEGDLFFIQRTADKFKEEEVIFREEMICYYDSR